MVSLGHNVLSHKHDVVSPLLSGQMNRRMSEDAMNGGPSGPPPPPVPTGHPTFGGAPPPATPGGFSASDFNTARQQLRSPSLTNTPGFNTTPNPHRGGGAGFGRELSFEDELKGRLVKQREDIYATGATILRSNWNTWVTCNWRENEGSYPW